MRGSFSDSINIPDHQPPLSEAHTGFPRSSPTASYKPLPTLKLNLPRAEQTRSSQKRESMVDESEEDIQIEVP